MPADENDAALAAAMADFSNRYQIAERGFGNGRDLAQTGLNRDLCAEKEELVTLIRANNERAGR